jgi:hypothetical protein
MNPAEIIELDCQLLTCVEEYSQKLEEAWLQKLEAEDWTHVNQLMRDAREIADTIHERVLALQNVGDQATLNAIFKIREVETRAAHERAEQLMGELAERLREKLNEADVIKILNTIRASPSAAPDPEERSDRPLHLIWQYLCVKDGLDSSHGMRARVARMFQLEELIEDIRHDSLIPGPTQQFLALVARTFVWGFDAECVIVCRGVIDTMFRDKVPQKLLESRTKPDRFGEYKLAQRIEAAYPTIITIDVKLAAERVNCRGSKAVHGEPHLTQDVVGTVRDALLVVDELAKHPDTEE